MGSIYNNRVNASFSIDKILKQRINADDSSQTLYVVYHRIGLDSSKIDTAIFIKLDEKAVCFSVYPYEFLEEKGYLNLAQRR